MGPLTSVSCTTEVDGVVCDKHPITTGKRLLNVMERVNSGIDTVVAPEDGAVDYPCRVSFLSM